MTDLYAVMGFLEKFQAIERKNFCPLVGRGDTDAEHSYSLAMVAWQIIIHDKLPLDVDLVLKYALVHDLVEVYAGDEFAFVDEAAWAEKVAREREALGKMKGDVNWREITKYIEEYEKKEDEESRFVWGLDKLLIPVACLMNDYPCPAYFNEDNPVTFEKWRDRVESRVLSSKYLRPYYDWLISELEEHPEQFVREGRE